MSTNLTALLQELFADHNKCQGAQATHDTGRHLRFISFSPVS
jgi:hypothetical protein